MKYAQILLFVALGAAFWVNAALIIHVAGARVFSADNPYLVLFFALAAPLTLLSMRLAAAIGRRRMHQLLGPVVVMTFTATMCDGVALAWFRGLYSPSFEVALHGAAWILWGVGLGLLFAYAWPRPGAAKPAGPAEGQ